MPDHPDNLVPAERYELLFDLKMALTRTKKFNKQDRADLIASMAAEHVLEHLERSRYVIMQRAPEPRNGVSELPLRPPAEG